MKKNLLIIPISVAVGLVSIFATFGIPEEKYEPNDEDEKWFLEMKIKCNNDYDCVEYALEEGLADKGIILPHQTRSDEYERWLLEVKIECDYDFDCVRAAQLEAFDILYPEISEYLKEELGK